MKCVGDAQAQDPWQPHRGLAVSFSAIRLLQKRAAEQQRTGVAWAPRRWMREQRMFDPARLVFVDETAANTKMVRLCGRGPRGERLIGRVPQGHWKTITFVAALRRIGMRAPCTVDVFHERRQVPVLCQTVSGPDPQTQEYSRDGQSSCAQGGWHTRGD